MTNLASVAMSYCVPVLAATLAFVAYTNTGDSFDVAVIFASFALFNLLRQPLMFLPRALSNFADARSAVTRLEKVFHAELMEDIRLDIDVTMDVAIKVEHATFGWEESAPKGSPGTSGTKKDRNKDEKGRETKRGRADSEKKMDVSPFMLHDVNLVVPRGRLVAIVGRVGSGKVSRISWTFS